MSAVHIFHLIQDNNYIIINSIFSSQYLLITFSCIICIHNRLLNILLVEDIRKRQNSDIPVETADSILHIKWDKGRINDFKSLLVDEDSPNMNPEDPLDSKAESFSRTILDVAGRCGYGIPIQRSSNSRIVTKHKPNQFKWFDDECKRNKQEVYQKMNRWRQNHSDSNLRSEYYKAKTKWKKTYTKKEN